VEKSFSLNVLLVPGPKHLQLATNPSPGLNFGAILPYLFEATNKVIRLARILAVADLRNLRFPCAILQAHVIGESKLN